MYLSFYKIQINSSDKLEYMKKIQIKYLELKKASLDASKFESYMMF